MQLFGPLVSSLDHTPKGVKTRTRSQVIPKFLVENLSLPQKKIVDRVSWRVVRYILAALLLVASLGSWQALGPKELGEDARDMEGHRNHLVAWSAKRPLWQPVFVHDKLRTFESL